MTALITGLACGVVVYGSLGYAIYLLLRKAPTGDSHDLHH
jgi:hypothetical protein